MTDSLLDYVLAHLEDRRGQWKQISRDTGIPLTTLQNIGCRNTRDPGVRKIEKLAAYFRERVAKMQNGIGPEA